MTDSQFAPNRFQYIFLAIIGLLLVLVTTANSPVTHPAAAPELPSFASMPLYFEPNGGQFDTAVHFRAGNLYFTAAEVVFTSADDDKPIRLQFEEANPESRAQTLHNAPGRVNYLVGNDPDKWLTDLPLATDIAYRELYPGITLVYNGQEGRLKGTYYVAPGADPGQIRWRYEGAAQTKLDPVRGDLAIYPAAAATPLIESAPVAWQSINGRLHPVSVAYALADNGRVAFDVGAYDPAHELVIDPMLIYTSLIGGSEEDQGRDIVVDSQGNTYVVGQTLSPDFPNMGPPQPDYGGPVTSASVGDAFIMKLNADGDAIMYATYLGGAQEDIADGVALLGDGSVAVTGSTRSADFPTANALYNTLGGDNDAFVARLNAAGNQLVFSTYLGGSNSENSWLWASGAVVQSSKARIAADSANHIYVTGVTDSTDFPLANAAFSTGDTAGNVFVSKLSPDGQNLLYSTYLGGSASDESGGIVAGGSGQAVVVGNTLSSDFPTRNPYQSNKAAGSDAFVAVLDTTTSGNGSFDYGTYFGGDGGDTALGVGLDSAGNIYLAGHTLSTDLPTQNAFQPQNASQVAGAPLPRDAFLTKLNADGSQLLYSSYLGGSDGDTFYDLDVTANGHAFLVGISDSTDFPVREAWQGAKESIFDSDVIAVRFDTTRQGNASLIYSSYLGGPLHDYAYGADVDQEGNLYLTGETSGGPTNSEEFPLWHVIGPNATDDGVLVAKLASTLHRAYLPIVVRQ